MVKYKIAKNQYQIEDLIYYELLKPMYKDPNLQIFCNWINPKDFDNYYKIVKNPICLHFIMCKFYDNQYQFWRRVKRDINQLQENWVQYFKDQTNHVKKKEILNKLDIIKKYQESFDVKLEKLLQKLDGSEDDEFIIIQDKIDLDFDDLDNCNQQLLHYQNKKEFLDQQSQDISKEQESSKIKITSEKKNSQKKKKRKSKYYVQSEDDENQEEEEEENQDQQEDELNYDLEEKIYNHLLKPLYNRKQFEIFQEPVDKELEGCENYYEIIENPMDFNKIYEKLEQGKYEHLDDIMKDLNLIKDNCILFNGEDNDFTKPIVDNYIISLEKTHKKLLSMLERAGINKDSKIKAFNEYTMLTPEEKEKIKQKELQEEKERQEKKQKNHIMQQEDESFTESYEGSSRKRTRNMRLQQQTSTTSQIEDSKNYKNIKENNIINEEEELEIEIKKENKNKQNNQQKQQSDNDVDINNNEPEILKKVKFNENYSDIDVEQYTEVIDSMFPNSEEYNKQYIEEEEEEQQQQQQKNNENQNQN